MHTGLTSDDVASGGVLEGALEGWARLPGVASALERAGGACLVLDAGDGRVVHATGAASPLAAALAPTDRADLAARIARVAVAGGNPRLVRLRLDPRRVAPPALYVVAGAPDVAGHGLVLVVPSAPPTFPRTRRPRAGADGPIRTGPVPVAARRPAPGDRFVWRTDADGIVTGLTGAAALAPLIGRRWHDSAEAGLVADAGALLDGLRAGRTVRAAPAVIDPRDGGGRITVAVSGSPLARVGAAFGGFGIVRSVEAPAPADRAVGPSPDAPPPSAVADHPPPYTLQADPALSSDEHAAFREIARALGARYVGDDAPPDAADDPPRRPGSVMPFPGASAGPGHGRAQDSGPRGGQEMGPGVGQAHGQGLRPDDRRPRPPAARDEDLLAALPLPALVHRDATILATNPLLLDLTGYADLPALADAGLGRLMRALPAGGTGLPARRTAIEARDGRARPVEVLGAACTWAGEAAECLILRPLEDEDAAGMLAAERLARAASAARAEAAEAALDAVEVGVATIDAAGRVVALNRAAAAMVGAEPGEVLGGSFVGLFDPGSARTVVEALREAPHGPHTVCAGARTLTLDIPPAHCDGTRIAVLAAATVCAPPTVPAPPADDRPVAGTAGRVGLLAGLGRDMHEAANAVVAQAEAMASSAPGDPHAQAHLSAVRTSGERIRDSAANLIDLAALDAGTLDLDPRPLSLNEVVAGCVARHQADAGRGRIVLRTSFQADIAALHADASTVGRAAGLVIEAAIRRSAAGGQVIVSTGFEDDAGIFLRVRDTGAAGPAGALDRAGADDRLALSRALVEANGGTLRLARRADADGTLVELIFPGRPTAVG